MNRKHIFSFSMAVLLGSAALALAEGSTGSKADGAKAAASQSSTQPAAIDLANTVCPVTGDQVGDSKLVETYEGKIYHFCCDGCPADFKKDPAKFAKLVAADPKKYGVTTKP